MYPVCQLSTPPWRKKNTRLMERLHALLFWLVSCPWSDMVELSLRIVSEPTPKHPRTSRSQGPHRKTNSISVRLRAFAQLLFLCLGCPQHTADAALSCYSGWLLPKWTRCLTASDKLSARLISATTRLSGSACVSDPTLHSRPEAFCYGPYID